MKEGPHHSIALGTVTSKPIAARHGTRSTYGAAHFAPFWPPVSVFRPTAVRHQGDRPRRRRRGDGRFHPPDSVCRRPRGDPAATPRSDTGRILTPDLIYDQLIGAGCAAKLVFSWGGNPGVGSLHRLRDAVEHGWPRPLALDEFSHGAMAQPTTPAPPRSRSRRFAARRVLAGVNPNYRTVACPFTGETLMAVPAMRPDVTIIHAQRADRDGNVLIDGIIGVQKEAVLAAARRSSRSRKWSTNSFDALGPTPAFCRAGPSGPLLSFRAAPSRRTPSATTSATRLLSRWDAIARDRATFHRVDRRARDAASGRTRSPRRAPGRMSAPGMAGDELMTVAAARAVGDDDVCFVGIGSAVGRLQPRAADARAGITPDLRIRHDPARGQRCCRCRLVMASCARPR